MAIPSQSTKLNVCQSVVPAKSPNLMSAKYTTPTVYSTITIMSFICNIHALSRWALHIHTMLHIYRHLCSNL